MGDKREDRKRGCKARSNKEKVVELLDSVPEYKMGYVLAYVQGITADEEADEIIKMTPIRKRMKAKRLKSA